MIRIGSIVLRVDDLQRQTEFWEAALGYVRRDSGESDDFVLLGPPDGAPEVWSVYGSERSQPVATSGRWDDLESGKRHGCSLPERSGMSLERSARLVRLSGGRESSSTYRGKRGGSEPRARGCAAQDSTRITSVSGSTPSCSIASAAA